MLLWRLLFVFLFVELTYTGFVFFPINCDPLFLAWILRLGTDGPKKKRARLDKKNLIFEILSGNEVSGCLIIIYTYILS